MQKAENRKPEISFWTSYCNEEKKKQTPVFEIYN